MSIKQIFAGARNEFVYGGHLFALGAVSVVLMNVILFNILIKWDFLLVTYLIFYSIYLNDHFRGTDKDFLTNKQRSQYLRNRRKVPLIIYSSIIILGIILFYYSNFYNSLFSFVILFAGLSYEIYFKKITKKIIAFKNFFVSFVWALMIVFLAFYHSYSFTFAMFLMATFIFLRMLTIQIIFDIRDIKSDKKEKLLTIPVVFGKNKTINILKQINILTILLIIYGLYINIIPQLSFVLILIIFYSFYYIKKIESSINNSSYFLSIATEPIFWSILVLFGKFLLYQ